MANDKTINPGAGQAGEMPSEQATGATAYMESAASSDNPDLGAIITPDSLEPPSAMESKEKAGPEVKPPLPGQASDFPSDLLERAYPEGAFSSPSQAMGFMRPEADLSTAFSNISTKSVSDDGRKKSWLGIFFNAIKSCCLWFGRKFSTIPPLDDIVDRILLSLRMQRKPAGMLHRANSLANAGRFLEAVNGYRNLLALKPLTVAAYDGLGRVYLRMGLTEEAHRELSIADSMERILQDRDDIEAAATLALSFLARKQAKVSISLIEPVLIAHFFSPDNGELLKAMGLVYIELRANKKAFQVYSAGLVQHPEDYEFHILKGESELKMGNVAEGGKLVRWGRAMKKFKENPHDPKTKMALGEMYIGDHKMPEGLALLEEAATLEPENTGIRWRLFNLYQKEGNIEASLKYFLEVVALDDDNLELKYRLADFYCRNKHKDEAADIYRKLSLLTPRAPKPYELLGELLTEVGVFDEGQQMKDLAQILECGLKKNPDHMETFTFMKYLFSIGEHEEGNQWLERGLAKWPYHGELIMAKAKMFYNSYRYQEAVVLLKRLISMKSNAAEPHIWIAMCYQKLSDNMAALAEAQLATRLAPKSYTAHKVLGDVLKEQKKLSQANAAYEVAEMIRGIKR